MTGGGWASEDPPPLLGEAIAILHSLLADFTSWGRLPVVTTWDDRRPAPDLPADEVVPISASSYREGLSEVARRCGAAVVIAPETGGGLERTTALLEDQGVLVVGSPSAAVAAAADRPACLKTLGAAGVPCPLTTTTTAATVAEDARRAGYPVVLKPRRGAGCEGVVLVAGEDQLGAALAVAGLAEEPSFVLQEYVDGEAVSVSVLAAAAGVALLGVNAQDVHPGIPFEYRGGVAGISHPLGGELVALACAAVTALPGLRGYVGVDLIVSGDRCVVIEVNPRVTTSYLGLRRVLPVNPAELLWRSSVDGELPQGLTLLGQAAFRKGEAGA